MRRSVIFDLHGHSKHSCVTSRRRRPWPCGSHERRRWRKRTLVYDADITCGTYYITRAPHKSRIFSLYGRAGRPALQARLGRRVSRTGIGTARWPSHGPFDLPKGPTSRSGVTSRPTGTGDSTALTPWDKSDTVWEKCDGEGVARASGDDRRPCRCRGHPGDPSAGSGRPAGARRRLPRANSGSAGNASSRVNQVVVVA